MKQLLLNHNDYIYKLNSGYLLNSPPPNPGPGLRNITYSFVSTANATFAHQLLFSQIAETELIELILCMRKAFAINFES